MMYGIAISYGTVGSCAEYVAPQISVFSSIFDSPRRPHAQLKRSKCGENVEYLEVGA